MESTSFSKAGFFSAKKVFSQRALSEVSYFPGDEPDSWTPTSTAAGAALPHFGASELEVGRLDVGMFSPTERPRAVVAVDESTAEVLDV